MRIIGHAWAWGLLLLAGSGAFASAQTTAGGADDSPAVIYSCQAAAGDAEGPGASAVGEILVAGDGRSRPNGVQYVTPRAPIGAVKIPEGYRLGWDSIRISLIYVAAATPDNPGHMELANVTLGFGAPIDAAHKPRPASLTLKVGDTVIEAPGVASGDDLGREVVNLQEAGSPMPGSQMLTTEQHRALGAALDSHSAATVTVSDPATGAAYYTSAINLGGAADRNELLNAAMSATAKLTATAATSCRKVKG